MSICIFHNMKENLDRTDRRLEAAEAELVSAKSRINALELAAAKGGL